jgi:hypothetical protein
MMSRAKPRFHKARSLACHMMLILLFSMALIIIDYFIFIYESFNDKYYIINKNIKSSREFLENIRIININNLIGDITVVASGQASRCVEIEVVGTAKSKQPSLIEGALLSIDAESKRHGREIEFTVDVRAAIDPRVDLKAEVRVSVPENLIINIKNMYGCICIGCHYDGLTGRLKKSPISAKSINILSKFNKGIYVDCEAHKVGWLRLPCFVSMSCDKGPVIVEGNFIGRTSVGNNSRIIGIGSFLRGIIAAGWGGIGVSRGDPRVRPSLRRP